MGCLGGHHRLLPYTLHGKQEELHSLWLTQLELWNLRPKYLQENYNQEKVLVFKRSFSSRVWDKLPMELGASPFTSWDFTFPYSEYSSSSKVFPLHILFPGQIGTQILEGKNKKRESYEIPKPKILREFSFISKKSTGGQRNSKHFQAQKNSSPK